MVNMKLNYIYVLYQQLVQLMGKLIHVWQHTHAFFQSLHVTSGPQNHMCRIMVQVYTCMYIIYKPCYAYLCTRKTIHASHQAKLCTNMY